MSPISRFLSDSNSDQSDIEVSIDSLSLLPKQPHIEPAESIANIDVADLAKRRRCLTESEKYNHFTPDIDYKFPRERGRSFLYRYLRKYNWLVYSRQENIGYCFHCVLFARSTDSPKGKGVFIVAVFTNFNSPTSLPCQQRIPQGCCCCL